MGSIFLIILALYLVKSRFHSASYQRSSARSANHAIPGVLTAMRLRELLQSRQDSEEWGHRREAAYRARSFFLLSEPIKRTTARFEAVCLNSLPCCIQRVRQTCI